MSELPAWLQTTISVLVFLIPGGLWTAYCLWAVNWKKMTAVLREGAWIAAVLLVVLVALVWSQIAPSSATVLGVIRMPNFWWQLGSISILTGFGLFAGWIQDRYSWTPPEVAVEPDPHAGHGHDDHGHGHDDHAPPAPHTPPTHEPAQSHGHH